MVAGFKGSILFLAGVAWGPWGLADGVCIPLGAPWAPTTVSGWFADSAM